MTNREQVAWAFGFSDYDARGIADIVSDMLDAAGAGIMDKHDREQLAAWMELDCDPETNNWGKLPCCETCRWYDPDQETCFNGDSEFCTEFMGAWDNCQQWEKREE